MWTHAIATILSIVAFLGGLRVMRSGLTGLAEGTLTKWLQRLVATPSRGILTGAFATAILQSSAALTAIAVGLVAAGSITFPSGLAVVLGANVGSTITPQLLNLNLWGIVLPALIAGIILVYTRKPKLGRLGEGLVGFACIFISLQALKTSLEPLAASNWFHVALLHAGARPLLALAIGCGLSAIVQSSTATTLIAMALAADGLISVVGGIAIALGANVGTCLTSVIAAIGTIRPAQQVALAHVLLNVLGVVAFVPLLQPFAHVMAMTAEDPAQQIANANTAFNLLCTLIVWPFTRQFASLVERLLPAH
ncbi:hypothetical protein Alches_03450 [Alicyclobacillus hesperidum subsp. aegles]|uniref:Na/Pi cotransporter family protein n=1 Tax=Alicyclobacillus hesperidum TaxID=89784 RepID=UPI0007193BC7|nr:Na/Pi symporter [Alicyclobacillus hesperidum]KRW91703.1 Na/Pi cotransporter [Alicyclobacillus tengchongensis]GLG00306.1 hypothetical protein Alches_03450 [Alicyclobacillus hesperidum subsp. aegles]